MRRLRIWLVASVFVLVVAACGDDSTDRPDTTSPAGSDAEALAETSWVAQRMRASNPSGEREALAGNEPTIEFGAHNDGRTVSGSTPQAATSTPVTSPSATARSR